MRIFDRKFGKDFLAQLPASPGVYRVYDSKDELIYVGKAKNLRRRLAQYRNAKRRKKHLKMKEIVKGAARLEYETCPTELDACLLENRLIRQHRPRWNITGAFYFLYPMIGIREVQGALYFCYTNEPQRFQDYRFHGAFRSRDITRAAFFALMELLGYLGHRIPRGRIPVPPRFSYVFGFRQIPKAWVGRLEDFLEGKSRAAIEDLILSLVENAGARKSKREVQENLNLLKRFFEHEAISLLRARLRCGSSVYPVPQLERDEIFLKYRLSNQQPEPKRSPVEPVAISQSNPQAMSDVR